MARVAPATPGSIVGAFPPLGPELVLDLDLLGVATRLELEDRTAAEHLSGLLANLPCSHGPVRHVLRLVLNEPRNGYHRSLYADGSLVRAGMVPPEAIAMVLWELNQHALTTKGYVVVHAGCVARRGRAIVLSGEMEAGKSTLVTALVAEGWDYLSDEFAAVSLDDGFLHPYAAPIALDPGSFGLFESFRPRPGEFDAAACWHLRPERVRAGCVSGAVPPAAVVLMRYKAGAPCKLVAISPTQALCLLVDQALNFHLLQGSAVASLGRLVRSVRTLSLSFGDLAEACAALAALDLSGP